MTVATVRLKDGRQFKLGRIRPKARTIALSLARYVDLGKALPKLPDKVDWSPKAMESIKRVYANDQYGDCVIAGKYHQIGIWTGNDSNKPVVVDDREVIDHYHRICGPGDNGCIITDVLDYFMRKGLTCNGTPHRIDGYVAVDWTNEDLVRVALALFGSLTLGINLPSQWTCTDCIWDEHASGNVGGHDICAVGYNQQGVQCCTWGGIVTITWPAFTSRRWIEECWCQLAPDWYGDDSLSPMGVNVKALKDDLEKIRAGDLPPLPDPEPPAPPLPPVPPVPPVTAPVYEVSVTGKVPGHLFGHEFITLTGAAVPYRGDRPQTQAVGFPDVDWPRIIMDLIQLLKDFLSQKTGQKHG